MTGVPGRRPGLPVQAPAVRARHLLARRRPDQRRRHADHRQPGRQLRRQPVTTTSRLQRSSSPLVVRGLVREARRRSRSTRSSRPGARRSTGLTVLFTFALGTAAGDLTAERLAVGYWKSALLFGGLIAAGLRRAREVRAERDPRVLDRLHPDAPARRIDRRLPLAASGRRRPRARHDGDERDLPLGDPRRRRLPHGHEGRPHRGVERRRRRARSSAVAAATADPRRREQDGGDAGAGRGRARSAPRPDPRRSSCSFRTPTISSSTGPAETSRGRAAAGRGAAAARGSRRRRDRRRASRRARTPTTTSCTS